LDELGLVPKTAVPAGVAVLDFDEEARPVVMALAADLRRAGISTELYLGCEETLKGQLAWAVKGGFPFVAIMGARERAAGVVQLKDMTARTQEEIPLASLAERLMR
jgi:histidyl-tRNA synthetase